LKIVLIFFSIFLFASEANVKYISDRHLLYVYVKTPYFLKCKFDDLRIDKGNVKLLKDFSYFHNGYYYIGKKYLVNFDGDLVVTPLKIKCKNKIFVTKRKVFSKFIEDEGIYITVEKQKSRFFNILIIGVFVYLMVLLLVYIKKMLDTSKKIGYYDRDIKKFYYFLAINGFKEVEILNKYKNLFKRDFDDVEEIADRVLRKIVDKNKFIKEFIIFGIILVILFGFKVME